MTPKQVRGIARAISRKLTDPVEAAKALAEKITPTPELLPWLVKLAAQRLIYIARHQQLKALRKTLPTAPRVATDRKVGASATLRIHELIARKRRWLDEYTLPNGKRLGDATGTECMECAGQLEAEAQGTLAAAAYLRRIGAMAGEQVVRKALSHKQAEMLWKQISGPAKAA